MGNPMKQNQGDEEADVEGQEPAAAAAAPGAAAAVTSVRWGKEDVVKKGSGMVLRPVALVFSFLSFVIMAANKEDGVSFTVSEPYSYLLSVGVIATVYTAVQVFVYFFVTQPFMRSCTSALFDFLGDQVMAYLLISSLSSAIPITNDLRKTELDTTFDDFGAASISMAFFAFIALALSAFISAYKLSTLS